jgi:hypothetical protein
VPGTEIYYSIQGNILRPGEVVPKAVEAFLATSGALTDRVMAAMDAADASGGDSRCTCPAAEPGAAATTIPCEGRTSYVAYIAMAERTDKLGETHVGAAGDTLWAHNSGTYSMYLTVSQPTTNSPGAIKPGEDLNPVKTLRMRYDAWRSTQPASYR